MSTLGGYIFGFEKKFADILQEKVEKLKPLQETLSMHISDKYKEVRFNFISSENNKINYAVLVEQGRKPKDAIFSKSRLKFYNYLEIYPSISIDDLSFKLNEELPVLPLTKSQESSQYLIEQCLWEKLVKEIKKLRPKLKDEIDAMLNKVSDYSFSGQGFDLMAQEKDAIYLALDFAFDGTRRPLDYRLSNTQKPEPFLDCIRNEDNCIDSDSRIVKYWCEKEEGRNSSSRTFMQGKKCLTITNVNRRKCEEALGVDLIYYNHEHESFVMVQYKIWQKDKKGYSYRPNNQYNGDIERMKRAEKSLQNFIQNQQNPAIHRLNSMPFYFKLCKPAELSHSNELISGTYIQYSYLEKLMNCRAGERGGMVLLEENIKNSINNQLFIDLVKNGLIGSISIDKNKLNTIIKGLLEQGNSVTIAESYDKNKQA